MGDRGATEAAERGELTLNDEQRRALQLVRRGENIFLTGPAGTGKSLTVSEIIKEAESIGEVVAVTATTGLAASHLSHVSSSVRTLHSWAGIGLGKYPPSTHAKFINRNPTARERIVNTDILVVDEVSMLHPDFLSKVNDTVKLVRKRNPHTSHIADKPFGGIQLVFTGDFGQLPPVQKDRKPPSYLFQDPIWTELIDKTVVLTQVYRQKDKAFVDLLTRIREGRITNEDVELIRSTTNNELGDGSIAPTVLFCRNVDVDRMNYKELAKLEGEHHKFVCKDWYADERAMKEFKSTFNMPEVLPLKVGAQVMLLKNLSPEDGLVNGSRGIVTSISLADAEQDTVDQVQVKFLNGMTHNFERVTQESTDENGVAVATRTQFPLRLAWCMTIHKSQGMTIDLLEIDLRGTFEVAQAYVAISRGVGLDRMRVRNFTKDCVIASPSVIQFQKELTRKRARDGETEGAPEFESAAKRTSKARPST